MMILNYRFSYPRLLHHGTMSGVLRLALAPFFP